MVPRVLLVTANWRASRRRRRRHHRHHRVIFCTDTVLILIATGVI